MLKFLVTDQNGNKDLAKMVYMLVGFAVAVQVLVSGISIPGVIEFSEVDYSGMAQLLGAGGIAHAWRSHTKATSK